MRIALAGTRGIPARYGGFETFAEELSVRLVARGHQVTVFTRRSFNEPARDSEVYRGVNLRQALTIKHKYLETPVHALFTFLKCSQREFDLILLCNAANSPFAWLPRLRRLPVIINVDGIERQRKKWSQLGKLWYLLGEHCSVWFGSKVVADAEVIARYYLEHYQLSCTVVGYGATYRPEGAGETLAKFKLNPGKYMLYVSRLEPENNALGVIQAYNQLATDLPLVIVGDAPYAKEYIEELRRTAGKNVVFTGYQFEEAYRELRTNCALYIQASEVGGTHPALVEAMAYGNCIVANDTPEHREVLESTGVYYKKNDFGDLRRQLEFLLSNPEEVSRLGKIAQERAAKIYSWEHVTDQYEKLFTETLR